MQNVLYYKTRKVANYAKEKGLISFTTTLLVSPYQDHEMIKEIGERFAGKKRFDICIQIFPKVLEKVRNRPGNEIV